MLSPTQKSRLVEAVLLAQGPGNCKYVMGYEPGCVIGQLGALCGVLYGELKLWDDCDTWPGENPGTTNVEAVMGYLSPSQLREYPRDLLVKLQDIWDVNHLHLVSDETLKRMAMLFEIEAWDE
jgi:hypothetical protein